MALEDFFDAGSVLIYHADSLAICRSGQDVLTIRNCKPFNATEIFKDVEVHLCFGTRVSGQSCSLGLDDPWTVIVSGL